MRYQENLYVQVEQVNALEVDIKKTDGQVDGRNTGDDDGPKADGLEGKVFGVVD